jgi:diguanylate cyclase (GGDEF)-like protein/PAS domain S-box-containing protein
LIKNIIDKFFDYSEESYEQIIDKRRTKFIFLTGSISIVTLIFMGITSYLENYNTLFLVDFTATTILLTMLFIFLKTKNTDFIATAGIIFIGVFFLFLLAYGGPHKSAFLWLYLYPFIAMYLKGHKKGIIYSMLLLILSICYFYFPIKNESLMIYSNDLILRFVISFFILTILTYFSEASVNNALQTIDKKNKELTSKINELSSYKSNLQTIINDKTKNLELYEKIFNQAKEYFIIMDNKGIIIDVNNHFLQMINLKKEDLIGKPLNSLNYCHINIKTFKEMLKELKDKDFWSGELSICSNKNKPIPVRINISSVNENGKIKYFIITIHDISYFKSKEKLLYQKAFCDDLTHLPNKSYCIKEVKRLINTSTRKKKTFAVLFLDLDDFKNINDTRGHHIGDKFLIAISNRIKTLLRDSDIICRMGGDEFLIVLDFNDNIRFLHTVCKRIINEFKKPVKIGELELYSGISIGISIFPKNGRTVENLIKNADIAMYKSKMNGKNTFSFFTDEDQEELNHKINIESKVENAIKNNNLFLEYQQIFDNNLSKVVGYEALVRLKQNGNILYPGDFIPHIEGTPIIVSLTNEVIKKVCQDIPRFRELHPHKIFVSINIPEEYLSWEGSCDYLKNIFKEYNISTGEIEFEFKENAILKYAVKVFQTLINYNKLGINLSIDDFGTGYSSLQKIQKLKINKLKIDKIFINDMEFSETDRDFCKTIIDIAYNLNIFAVAEGVEKKSHIELLKKMKCHYLQGYLLGKPTKIENLFDNRENQEELVTN